MRLALLPKANEFYDLFADAGANALEVARRAETLFREHPNSSVRQSDIKDLEHEEFMRVISPWEREHLLLHV